jgi:hypothetical protein
MFFRFIMDECEQELSLDFEKEQGRPELRIIFEWFFALFVQR